MSGCDFFVDGFSGRFWGLAEVEIEFCVIAFLTSVLSFSEAIFEKLEFLEIFENLFA